MNTMLIRREYDPAVGPIVGVFVGQARDARSPKLTKVDALLCEDEPRTAMSSRLAASVGVPMPVPPHRFVGDVRLDILIDGDEGMALFKGVTVDVSHFRPTSIPYPADVGSVDVRLVLGRDIIECGQLALCQEDDKPPWFLFGIDTKGVIPTHPYTPGRPVT